jgi:HEAT repeat protein
MNYLKNKVKRLRLRHLLQQLQSNDPLKRARSAYSLGWLNDKSAIESLILALDDSDARVRAHATGSLLRLVDMNDTRAYAIVDKALQDSDSSVRDTAVSALSPTWRDAKPVEPLLVMALEQEIDQWTRLDIAMVLLKLHNPNASKYIFEDIASVIDDDALTEMEFDIVDVFARFGADAVGPLIDALSLTSMSGRAIVCGALGEIGDDRAIDALIPMLDDADWYVRVRVIEALTKLHAHVSLPSLMQLAQNDEHRGVREEAKRAIEQIRSTSQ